ncbi:hypothetical protein GCK32_000693 [Trichostrongylus colubriformis]|uniref:Uncharacterized protein n=1 Tax=Trichostrongylus colubriformis TaxID=6319 RepID=A0AAN8FRM6_TRICO
MVYQVCQGIGADPQVASMKPRLLWQDITQRVNNALVGERFENCISTPTYTFTIHCNTREGVSGRLMRWWRMVCTICNQTPPAELVSCIPSTV